MNNSENEQNEFADMLDAYDVPKGEAVQVGAKICGKVIAIEKDLVFVDTGTKIEGTVAKAELLDDDGSLSVGLGDPIELYIVAATEDEIRLARALSGTGSPLLINAAYHDAIPVEGKVTSTCKGGFAVEIIGRRAFCPISQMDVTHVDNPEAHVGKIYFFQILEIEDHGHNIVLSRRAILEKEQEKQRTAFLDRLGTGDVLEGRVKQIKPYGVFVELSPGLEGMVHNSELSWSRAASVQEQVQIGDAVSVKVIGIEDDATTGRKKIALSVKQLVEDPWQQDAGRFRAGDRVKGRVIRCVPFGAFVEIASGIEGLVHISEMSYSKRIIKPEEVVQPGQSIAVVIKEIDLPNRRISLSIRDAEGDPWIEVPEKFHIGQIVEGVLEKKEKFGYFVRLVPGVTGLLPKSKILRAPQSAAFERLREGDGLMVVIEQIDRQERKITLRPGDAREAGDWRKYTADPQAPMSALGEKLQAALASQKKKR